MPLEYAGTGVLKEHAAVRGAVGLFDVSHLGKVGVSGPGAASFVNRTLSNDLDRIGPGRAQYTLCCDPDTGGVVDDLIAYLVSPDDVFLVPNAANSPDVVARLAAQAPEGVVVLDRHDELAVLAVQGPRSDDVLEALALPRGAYMAFEDAPFEDSAGVSAPVRVCRTGYTGQRGYELVCDCEVAPALWDAIVAAGRPFGLVPCGLGARDTLRTEMGYALHGQDIGPGVTPVQARLGWAVGWDKEVFWGREALVTERQRGPVRLLRGLRATGRGIPRPGMTVNGPSGHPAGQVTSGTFSPTLRTGVGLALLDSAIAEGAEVTVDVRGRGQGFTVTRPPFVPSHV